MDKLYALLALLGNVGNDLVFKSIAAEEQGQTNNLFTTLQALFIIPLSLAAVLIFQRGQLFHVRSILYAMPMGLLTYLVYMLILKSLSVGELSTTVTIYRLNFVLSSVLAVLLLHETLTFRKLAGLILCLAAILLFIQPKRGGGYLYSILAFMAAGSLNILIKVALKNGAEILPVILYRYLLIAALGGAVHLLMGRPRGPSKKLSLMAFIGGCVMLFSLYFSFAALKIGDVILVLPITQLGFIFGAAVSFLILKERISVLKIAGIALAVASIAVIG